MNGPDYEHIAAVITQIVLTMAVVWFCSRFAMFGKSPPTKRGRTIHLIVFTVATIGLFLYGWFAR